MAIPAGHAIEERMIQLLHHLRVDRAHFAGCMCRDVAGLAISHPDMVASLTLVCPRGLKPSALRPVSSRLLLITGDQGQPAQEVYRAAIDLPGAKVINLRDYFSPLWADVIANCTAEVGAAITQFLSGIQPQPMQQVANEAEGEFAGLSYRIRGFGAPLVLLPLGLAPSQWEPLITLLSERYCTITVTGATLGMVAFLEARAEGYLRIVSSLIDEAQLRPGESVLEVGCGSGVILRWLARHVNGANPITGVDINAYLLREATGTLQKENLQNVIELRQGNGESLPYPDHQFDVVLTCTVMEEGNAERMLAECVRVTKKGGRVVAIVRALDMPWWVNLPLKPELKIKAETQRGHVLKEGCADASLYRRMRQAGLENLIMLPQWASFSAGERLEFEQERIFATLNPDQANGWQEAVVQAQRDGTFFIAQPFHCAVGTKPKTP
jgi:SAM-dependent methyltransferase